MTCILLADDQALVRAGFRMILETQPDLKVVGEASDGAETVTLARQLQPDIILMDIRMPGVDGIEATRRLAQAGATARVLMLTTTTTSMRASGPGRAVSCSRTRHPNNSWPQSVPSRPVRPSLPPRSRAGSSRSSYPARELARGCPARPAT